MINMESSDVSTLSIEAVLKTIYFMVRVLKRQKIIILKVCIIKVKKLMELWLGKMETTFIKDYLKMKSLAEKVIWSSLQENTKALFILV